MNESYNYAPEEKDINFRDILDQYLRYWPLFLITVILALLVALVYLRFTLPTYLAISSIIIEDEEGKGPSSDAANFADLGLLGGLSTSHIENELGLLRSKRLMTNAVKALNLNVEYHAVNGIPKREIYKSSPFLIRMIRMDEKGLGNAIKEEGNEFTISPLENNAVQIEFESDDDDRVVKLGDVIELDYADFVIEAGSGNNDMEESEGVMIKFLPIESVASRYWSGFGAELVEENSTMIQVSIVDEVKQKARDILDQVVFEYNQEAIEDKNLIARNTAFFIDERLDIINSELDSVESGKEEFKEANRLTDIQAESSMIIRDVSEYKNKQQEVN
ncbi:MAG: tyrosine protein kinase, partial [Pricia sp.]